MKRLFIFAALFAAVTSCSKDEVDGVVMGESSAETHIIKLNSASTRVSVDDDSTDDWTFKWDDGETIGVWHDGSNYFNKYIISEDGLSFAFDTSADYVEGTMDEGRIFNPYVSSYLNHPYTFNICSQSSSTEPYMISAKYETIATDGSVSYDMYHIGAFVDLYINIESGSTLIGESISQIDVTGFNSGASIQLRKDLFIDDEKTTLNPDFYYIFSSAAIAVNHADFTLVEGQTNKVRFNIMPTTIAANGEVSVTATIGGKKYKTTITNGDTAKEFARAKHHTLYCTITADDLAGTWVDNAAEEYAGGDGESSDTAYQISTEAQLGLLAKNVNAATETGTYFKLTQNLDLSGSTWVPIGSSSNMFTGTFDGGDFAIKGITIETTTTNQGLFGYISAATVKNVSVDGTIISGNNAAGVVGYSASGSLIDNCHNAASVTGKTYAGGIVGYNEDSTVINCSNSGTIEVSSKTVGGIAGMNTSTSVGALVVNCYNSGETIAPDSGGNLGGIVGFNKCNDKTTDSNVENCYSYGVLSTTSAKRGMIVGNNNKEANEGEFVKYCYYDESVSTYSVSQTNYDEKEKEENPEYEYKYVIVEGMTTANMQAESFVATLNGYSTTRTDLRKWIYVAGDYPTFDTDTDTDTK